MASTIHIHPGIGNRGTLTREEIVKISRDVLAAHAHPGHGCRGGYDGKKDKHLLALSNMPNTYPDEVKTPLADATLDRMSSGIVFEDEIGEILAAHPVPGEVVVIEEVRGPDGERTEAGKAAKEEATWAAYRDPQVRLIFNARLSARFSELVSQYHGTPTNDPDRVSEPDAIELGPVMANGLRAMRFVDVKWHKVATGASAAKRYAVSPLTEPFFGVEEHLDLPGQLQLDDWMQLAHYYRHGRSLGVCDTDASLWAAVIGKEQVLVWSRLDEARFQRTDPETGKRTKQSALGIYDREFASALEVIDNAIARDLDPTVPALTYPEWGADIADSEYADVCLAELAGHGDGGHITLLPGVTSARAAAFYAAGITSIGDLARLDPHHELDGVKDLEPFVRQARVTYHGVPSLTGVRLDLPRADIEVDFDYEADHVLYQRGVRVTDRTGAVPESQMFWFDDFTGTEDGERDVFVAMWEKFSTIVNAAAAAGRSVCFYHYSKYERTADRKVAEKYAGQPGVPSVAEVERFYDSTEVVDLYPLLSNDVVWPTMSHSVKSLAKYVGFSWPEEGQNGAESMLWYRAVLAGVDAVENIDRLRGYNGADTDAQRVLRDWVSAQLAAGELAPVEDLPAPAAPVLV